KKNQEGTKCDVTSVHRWETIGLAEAAAVLAAAAVEAVSAAGGAPAAAPAVDMTKCAACKESIQGQLVKALGRAWHYEHFVCSKCRAELGKQNFYEKDSQPFCEPCYQNEFSPKCAYCQEAILDRCVTALDKSWHPEHFFCQQCTAPFTESSGFHERDGKPYCADCYNDAFAPKCAACSKAITSNYLTALEKMWHTECFVCRDCGSDFSTGSFYEHEGQPYCELHYHAHRGSLCMACEKPITSKCITAMGRKFHPQCFECTFCKNELSKGTFKERENKPYCSECFDKLVSNQ
uniref:Transforming growth factor beta-1-induced transcript 1 protein n=1 Tax=Macrostomum lignano TaxID=282301 RepID=A0A1I8H094_9PLAT